MFPIFILILSCATMSFNSTTNLVYTTDHAYNVPTCVSDIKVMRSEEEVLNYIDKQLYPQPSRIIRIDKKGEQEMHISPVYETKERVVEERIIKGYKLK